MGRRRAALLLFVLAIAIATTAGLWFRASPPVSAPETGAGPWTSGPAGLAPSDAGTRRTTPASGPDGRSASATDALADSEGSEGFPTLDVVVIDADGKPLSTSLVPYVYAVAAGGPGRADLGGGPSAAIEAEGRARLLLPSRGRYDIGVYWSDFARILARDVDVPRDGTLELRIPRLVEIEVGADGDTRASLGSLGFTLIEAHATGSARLPGRDEGCSRDMGVEFRHSRTAVLTVSEGVSYRVGVQASLLRVRPEIVTAPGKIWVSKTSASRDATYPLSIRVRCVPAERTFDHMILADIRFEGGPGVDGSPVEGTVSLDVGRPLSELKLRADLDVPHPSGVVTWSGPGIVPGSASYRDLTREGGKGNILRVDVEVFNPPDLNQGPVMETKTLRITAPPEMPREVDVEILADGQRDHVRFGAAESQIVEIAKSSAWALATAPGGFVAGPVRMPRAGMPDVRLVLGGFLVVVPARVPPAGLGETVLEREDGAPFVFAGRENFGSGVRVPLEPGVVLGPFEPGTVAFRVRVGGVDFGIVRAEVIAGAYEVLRIPALRPPTGPR